MIKIIEMYSEQIIKVLFASTLISVLLMFVVMAISTYIEYKR